MVSPPKPNIQIAKGTATDHGRRVRRKSRCCRTYMRPKDIKALALSSVPSLNALIMDQRQARAAQH